MNVLCAKLRYMDLNTSGIYAIVAPSGKQYIGSAINLRRRWNGHRTKLMRGMHHAPGLQNAYAKYGLDALQLRVLAIVEPAQLIETEQRFLDAHDFRELYNVCPTAGSRLGKPQTPATKEKIRAGQLGRTRSAETRARMSAVQLGRQRSDETRARISQVQIGRKQSPETCEKRATALRGKVHKDNKTGFTGVGPFRGKFRARWANKHLGLFDTPEAAYEAVLAAQMGLLDGR